MPSIKKTSFIFKETSVKYNNVLVYSNYSLNNYIAGIIISNLVAEMATK